MSPHDYIVILDAVRACVVILIVLGIALWATAPDGCPHCTHCQTRRRERERKQKEAQHEFEHRFFGPGECPTCGRKDPPEP